MNEEKEKYIIGVEEHGVSLIAIHLWLKGFVNELKKTTGLSLPSFVTLDNHYMQWCIPEKTSEKIAQTLFDRVKNDPEWFDVLEENLSKACKNLDEFSKEIENSDVSKWPDSGLLSAIERHEKLMLELIAWGMPSTLVDVPHPIFTNYANKLIEERINELKLSKAPGHYFSAITQTSHDTMQNKAEKEFKQLAKTLFSRSNVKTAFGKSAEDGIKSLSQYEKKILDKYVEEFVWAYYAYRGPVLTTYSVAVKLYDEAREPEVEKNVEKLPTVEKAEEELGFTEFEKRVFKAMRASIVMKCVRKDSSTHSMYAMRKVLEEIAKRTTYDFEMLEMATYEEIPLAFENQLDKNELLKRREYLACFGEKLPLKTLSGDFAKNEVAKRLKNNTKSEAANEVKGQCACPGVARGKVRIVIQVSDVVKVEKGDILVTTATVPEMVVAMKKAGAIVADRGGVTSHAAIVSRELGIPCVIGVKIATSVFKDGDLIEVDATKGIVKKVRI